VLLVEDEAVNAAVAEGYLEALGCTATWVESGAEAVASAAAERFDLILMDLSMPGMDGFATTALIRSQETRLARDRVPIVALTAHDAVRYREKCLAADMDDILSKPYTLDACRDLLRRWLRRTEPTVETPAPAAQTSASGSAGSLAPELLAAVDLNAVAALRQLGAGKQADLYAKLVDLFRASSTQSLTELKRALEQDDLAAAAAVGHKLAASAANVGALVYAQRARELEQQALAGQRERVAELSNALFEAHLPLLDALQGQLLRATA
jgi:CheY-like chemotaxis protein